MTTDTCQSTSHALHVKAFEATEPGLDLAGRAELITDLGRKFCDLVLDMMKGQRADSDKHPAMLEHGFDLGDERVVDLECRHRSEGRLGQQSAEMTLPVNPSRRRCPWGTRD